MFSVADALVERDQVRVAVDHVEEDISIAHRPVAFSSVVDDGGNSSLEEQDGRGCIGIADTR